MYTLELILKEAGYPVNLSTGDTVRPLQEQGITPPLPAPSPVNREGQIQHCQRDKAPTNTITSMLKVPERKCVP